MSTRIIKINLDKSSYISHLLNDNIGEHLDYSSYKYICLELLNKSLITKDVYNTLILMGSPNVLSTPLKQDSFIRANILKEFIVNIIKGE